MLGKTSSGGRGSARLSARRRVKRRRAYIAFSILFLLLLSTAIYGLRQSAVRISHINIFGADPALAQAAASAIEGYYVGLVPRDSIFFFPEGRIRSDILASDTSNLAVSIFREGFTGLSIKVDKRVAVGRWCGASRFDLASSSRSNLNADCYVFDANGLIYALSASTTETLNPFVLYAPLDSARSEPPLVSEVEPLRATIANADGLPSTFDFARQLATFGSPVSSVTLREGEVDIHLKSGTRVTYVFGDEQNAFTALTSAREKFNLADGSVEYVDLRFDGKVYLKRLNSGTVSE